jgi:hypothetical protein
MPHPGSPQPLTGYCGAKLRRSTHLYGEERFCCQRPLQGHKRCKLHGGRTPKGLDSPHWQGKGFSVALPERLAQRYDEAQHDPRLFDMRDSAAQVDALRREAWTAIQRGHDFLDAKEALHRLGKVERAFADLQISQEKAQAPTGGGVAALGSAIGDLRVVLELGSHAVSAKDEHARQVERQRRLAETHAKSLALTASTFSLQEIGALVGVLGASVRRNVANRETLRKIFTEFRGAMERYTHGGVIDAEPIRSDEVSSVERA